VNAAPWLDSPRVAASPPCGSTGAAAVRQRGAVGAAAALRRAHRWHLAAGVLGLACFALEDPARERAGCGWAHAAWHCLACASVSGYNALLVAQEAAVA